MLPMEKQNYRAKAINASFGTSDPSQKNPNGCPFVAIGFEVVDHETLTGETITWMGYFSAAASERSIESLQHLGFQGDDLSTLEDVAGEQCAALLPNVVEIVCEPEEYNNEWQLKVRWVNRIGHGRFKAKQPLQGAALKAFAAQMKGALRNAKGPNSKAPSHPNAPGNKTDIPF